MTRAWFLFVSVAALVMAVLLGDRILGEGTNTGYFDGWLAVGVLFYVLSTWVKRS